MAISIIIMNLFRLTYERLKAFAQIIHDGLDDHSTDFPSPTVTLVDFQTDIDALGAAITAWGVKGNRGSHADHLNLLVMAAMVKDDLRMLADYVRSAQPNKPALWIAVGFPLKRPKTPPQKLGAVQDFHQFISRTLSAGTIKLKWKRPEDTDNGDVKSYIIQYNNTGVQPAIDGTRGVTNVMTVTTDTSAIIEPPFTGANYFWITPVNAFGFGVSSATVFYNAPGKVE